MPTQAPTLTRGGPDGTLPDLPLELIERILSHVFLRPTPDVPSSPHYPLSNTTHILLVSRTIRELALPFFLRAITLTRPSDYVLFFHPQQGLFTGPNGPKLWSHVQEMSVVSGVYPPLLSPPRPNSNPAEFPHPPDLVELAIPVTGRLQHLCMLDNNNLDPSSATKEPLAAGLADLLVVRQNISEQERQMKHWMFSIQPDNMALMRPEAPRMTVLEILVKQMGLLSADDVGEDEEGLMSPERKAELLDLAVDNHTARGVRGSVLGQTRRAVLDLVVSTAPTVLRISEAAAGLVEAAWMSGGPSATDAVSREGVGKLVYHADLSAKTKKPDSPIPVSEMDLFHRRMENLASKIRFQHVHLEDFSSDRNEVLIAGLREKGVTPERSPKILRWTWEGEEGEVCEFGVGGLSMSLAA